MLLETTGTVTKVSGTSRPSGFKVRTSPVLFKTMSDNLYNDKIRAVIRELSCNAWDAHASAGKKNQPFEVHLPTQFESYFSITDYGTGLKFIKGGCKACNDTGFLGEGLCDECDGTGDYDAVKRLYCTYFASDKQDSNDAIGGFGLGSKSPFAYLNNNRSISKATGGFTVTNHYNGRTYNYDAHVGDEGLPEVVMMGEPVDTPDEPNGVSITFPVHPKDIWEFENKARSVFEFFEPRPILNKPIDIHVPNYSVKTDLWGMRKNAYTEQGDGLRAIMGNVQYTVGNIDTSRLSEAQKKMVGMPIDLFFQVGELQPAASREALSLVGDTIDNILARLDVVQADLLDEVKKQVDNCKTAWEARIQLHNLSLQTGIGALVNDAYHRGLLNGAYAFFKLDGDPKQAGGFNVGINELDYQHINLLSFRHNDRYTAKKSKKEGLFEFTTPAKRAEAYRDLGLNITKKSDYELRLSVNENEIYVINDLKTNNADRYVSFMLQTENAFQKNAQGTVYRRALVINRLTRRTPMNLAGDEAVVLLNRIGNPPVIKASDLKAAFDPLMKAEKDVRQTKRQRMNVRILCRWAQNSRSRYGGGWKKNWEKGDDSVELNDPTETKFYVLITGHTAYEPNLERFYFARDFINFVNKVRDSTLFPEIGTDTPIFGIKTGSKLLQDPSFVGFLPFVKTRIASTIPAMEMQLSLAVNPFSSEWKPVIEYAVTNPQLLAEDSPFLQFSQTLFEAEQADRTGHTTLVELAKALGISINNTTDFTQIWKELVNNYPILKFFHRNFYGHGTIEEKTALVDYIRMVDEQSKRLVLSDVRVVNETEEEETVNV